MVALVPAGGVLLETTELEYTSEIVTATGFSVVSSWAWSLSPSANEGVNFNFAGAGFLFTADYFSALGLFPLRQLDYLTPGRERVVINSFAELPPPAESPDIVYMEEDDKDLMEWELTVTATGLDAGSPAAATETYILRVFANYDTSKNELMEALNARS